MANEVKIKDLNRKWLLARLVQLGFQADKNADFLKFSVHGLMQYEGLRNYEILTRSLASLKKEIGDNFEYEILSKSTPINSDNFGLPGNKIPYAIKVFLDDQEPLDRYFGKIEKELKKAQIDENKKHDQFILDGADIHLVGSSKKPYKMRAGSLRHKIVYHLARAKKPVATQFLADEFDVEKNQSIRTAIERIRTEAAGKLGVARDALIKNDLNGYSTPNLTLKISKGHTP